MENFIIQSYPIFTNISRNDRGKTITQEKQRLSPYGRWPNKIKKELFLVNIFIHLLKNEKEVKTEGVERKMGRQS